MIEPREMVLSRLRRAERRVELRMRAGRAARALLIALIASLAAAAAALGLHEIAPAAVTPALVTRVMIGAALVSCLAPLVAAVLRLPVRAGAIALDRVHDLQGRIANALAFAEIPPRARTPFMEAAIDDACSRAGDIELRTASAAVIGAPRTLFAIAVFSLLVPTALVLSRFARPPAAQSPAPHTAPRTLVLLPAEDIEAFDGLAASLGGPGASPETTAAVGRLRALLRDIESGRGDRAQVLRQIAAIERDLPPLSTGGSSTFALWQAVGDLRDRLRQTTAAGNHGARRLRVFARHARGLRGKNSALGTSGGSESDGAPDDADEEIDDTPADEPASPPPPLAPPPPGPPSDPGTSPGPAPSAPDPEEKPAAGTQPSDDPGPSVRGARTSMRSHTFGTRARARESGHGPSKSKVILAAAERGFRGAHYASVFREYRSSAEETMRVDTIPAGYAFYVRRYFLLIRPRD